MLSGFQLEGNSVWQLIKQSDFLSRTVLITLFGMSVLCWTVFLCKLILAHLRSRDLKRALGHIKNVQNMNDLVTLASHLAGTVPGELLSQSLIFAN